MTDRSENRPIPRAGVIGWPVAHSRSPVIHGHWLARYGLQGRYDRIAVDPAEAEAFFAGFRDSGLAGANVTVPYKEAAAKACDVLDPLAEALGAVNTLWIEDGRLNGTNTDVTGFLANLDAEAPGWDAGGGAAVVLGAGGAARAVVYGLAARGFAPVHVVNRTRARAEAVAALAKGRDGHSVGRAHGFDELPQLLARARVLVNTTSLGMAGSGPLDVDLSPLPHDALVTDIVYVPLETPLLAAARLRGNPVAGGLGMLLHQAAPGFARWFGVFPEVDEALYEAVIATLPPEAGRR
ncbi:shikimate dehydrogenase [Pseudoxanthobacter sp.]|uniref:shikimate dehydrogenase n=1 Tax=Pseudoxanthobacter sp. TaxID=1925742 RepID=UPI002FE16C71